MRIFYIGHYSHQEKFRDLKTIPSGVSKMNYILSALKRAGFSISIFSTAPSRSRRLKISFLDRVSLNDNICVYYPFILGEPNLILTLIARLCIYIQLIFFVFFKVKKDDCLLIYHVWQYRYFIRLLRMTKKCRIFFEVEEIYHAAWQNEQKAIDKEIKYLQGADGYILVNDIIRERCRFDTDNFCVCYGDYNVHTMKSVKKKRDFIHLVYAGVLGEEGSDVYLAMEVMKLLPDLYNLSILGYGVDKDVEQVENRVAKLNSEFGADRIFYKGCLFGEEYSSFLAQCDIGLCTRVLQDSLSDYTFPSKVLVYLGHGLIPICSPITCIQRSKVASDIVFCENITPEAVSKAILSVEFNRIDPNTLSHLDSEFVDSLICLFGNT